MALVIRGIDDEARGCILDAFGYEGILGGLYWGISSEAEDFLKEKGISYEASYEKGVRVLTVKEWIEDEILDELDEIADVRLSDERNRIAYYGTKHSMWGCSIEDYIRAYGEDLE